MTHPVWPLFDLRVTTPRLELRYVDDELALALAELAARGVHDRDFMPFTVAWTDVEPPQLEVNTMQYYWRCRAEWSPTSWNLNLAVVVDGTVVGTTGAMAHDFATVGGGLGAFEAAGGVFGASTTGSNANATVGDRALGMVEASAEVKLEKAIGFGTLSLRFGALTRVSTGDDAVAVPDLGPVTVGQPDPFRVLRRDPDGGMSRA